MNQNTYYTKSPKETEELGEKLGKQCKKGDVFAFSGDLGAGKTALTRGIARGLGILDPVTSPTFTIVNEYLEGRLPLFHFDLYRLSEEEELFDMGFEEYFSRNGVCVVEWSERAPSLLEELAEHLIFLEMRVGEEEEERLITLSNFILDNTDC